LAGERPVQHRRQQRVEFRRCLRLQRPQRARLRLKRVEVRTIRRYSGRGGTGIVRLRMLDRLSPGFPCPYRCAVSSA
jgi:hypothetical protein